MRPTRIRLQLLTDLAADEIEELLGHMNLGSDGRFCNLDPSVGIRPLGTRESRCQSYRWGTWSKCNCTTKAHLRVVRERCPGRGPRIVPSGSVLDKQGQHNADCPAPAETS